MFVPIVDAGQVTAVFASRTPETLPLYSISGVLFEWDANGNLVSSAWSNAGYEEMLVFLSTDMTIDIEQEVDYFPIDVDMTILQAEITSATINGPVPPAPFVTGLFFNDPLLPVAQTLNDPSLLLTPLETIGYSTTGTIGGAKVGPPLPADGVCVATTDLLIQWIVKGAQSELIQSGTFLDAYISARSETGCTTCLETPVTTSTPTPWDVTCSSWQVDHTILLSGCRAKTKFKRSIIGTRSKTKTKVCTDCSVLQCTSDQSLTQHQTGWGSPYDISYAACSVEFITDPYAGGEPNKPCILSWSARVGLVGTMSTWEPPCLDGELVCP